MRAIIDPRPARLNELACRDHGGVPNNSDQVALATRFDAQHAEAIIGVMERYAVDLTGQNLDCRSRFD